MLAYCSMKETQRLIPNRMKATNAFRDRLAKRQQMWNRIVLTGIIVLIALPIALYVLL
jgi:hypothetical protein